MRMNMRLNAQPPISKYYVYLVCFLVALSAYWLFFVKQYAKDIKQQLDEVTQQINQEQDSIHMYRAELSYLRSPQRIKQLSEKYLKLEPVKPSQMVADLGFENSSPKKISKKNYSFDIARKKEMKNNLKLVGWRYKKGPGHKYITEASMKRE
jgi:cell division protein FtsL